MVNNPADINKTNNQFSPQIVEHKKKQWHIMTMLEIQVLARMSIFRDQDSHLGFGINSESNNTPLESMEEHFW